MTTCVCRNGVFRTFKNVCPGKKKNYVVMILINSKFFTGDFSFAIVERRYESLIFV